MKLYIFLLIFSITIFSCGIDEDKVNIEFEEGMNNNLKNCKTIDDSIFVYKNYMKLIDNENIVDKLGKYISYKSIIKNSTQMSIKTNISLLTEKKHKNTEYTLWNKSCIINSINAYKNYLDKYPDGKYSIEAQYRIDDDDFWNSCKDSLDENILIKYTENFKRHKIEAERLLKEIDIKKGKIELDHKKKKPKKNEEITKVILKSYPLKLHLLKLICNQQNEAIGKDRITLRVDDKYILNNKIMRTGDIVNLYSNTPIKLKKNTPLTISLVELDPLQNDGIMNFSISIINTKKGTYEKVGHSNIRGTYTLIYEIK